MSKREEFGSDFGSKLAPLGKTIARLALDSYDRGHEDGLSEGEELRKELVEALKDRGVCHLGRCVFWISDGEDCDCELEKSEALIARAEGGEQ